MVQRRIVLLLVQCLLASTLYYQVEARGLPGDAYMEEQRQSVRTERRPRGPFMQDRKQTGCGWESCNPTRPGLVNVHLVPHSHDDAGWLKTVDQYYFGARQDIQRAGVQYTIQSVVQELAEDPTKKFIQVETGFMWRWWEAKDEFMRNLTLDLVNSGQLQFAGGGWSMNDEAATHFNSIIENMEIGLNWLNDHLGKCAIPDVAWQIDPFGHSKEQARLFSEMGFKGLFFARIDSSDKDRRKKAKELQMIWNGGDSQDNAKIFTGVFDGHYSAPGGFCWDILCTDEPINDDPRLQEYNVDNRINEFIAHVEKTVQYYKDENHIMFTMGDDFHYSNAKMYYKNMDKLIYHMNKRSDETGIHVLYSTPSCYLKGLYEDGMSYPDEESDFFPYKNEDHTYWTGYFTSRPAIKLQERQGARDLTVCKQLTVPGQGEKSTTTVFNMQRAMGLMQHHDAVTGTEKQHVADDYAKRLFKATVSCQAQNIERMMELSGLERKYVQHFSQDQDFFNMEQTFCPNLNVSDCRVTEESDNFIIYIYNPLSQPASPYIRIPIKDPNIDIHTLDGRQLTIQVNEIPKHVLRVPSRNSTAKLEAVFRVFDVPPLGFSLLLASKHSHRNVNQVQPLRTEEKKNIVSDKNSVSVDMLYYRGVGIHNWIKSKPLSGAYVFSPDATGKHELGHMETYTIHGDIVNETILEYADWGAISIRDYLDVDYKEVVWQVGPIPAKDDSVFDVGREVVLTYSSNVNSHGVFYTDANGRQMMKRERKSEEELQGDFETANYYPVTSRLELRSDSGDILTVLPDRSEGGSSLLDGQLELMVHRRLFNDDGFGVSEPLNERETHDGVETPLVVRGRHLLMTGHTLEQARQRMVDNTAPVQLSFVPTNMDLDTWIQASFKEYSGLNIIIPNNVQVLTLSVKNDKTVLLRLYNSADKAENDSPVSVDVEWMFTEFRVESLTEMDLSGTRTLETLQHEQLSWNRNENDRAPAAKNELLIELKPSEIRTFLLDVLWIK